MNEQVSFAYSVQPDGAASYALSVIPQDAPEQARSLNLSSLGGDATDLAFIAALNSVIADYRTVKGF